MNFENIIGSSTAETIQGDGNNNILVGDGDNSTISSSPVGSDTIHGYGGNDILVAGSNGSSGFEVEHGNLKTTRDEYIYETTNDDGRKMVTSFNRKTLRRKFAYTEDGKRIEGLRECVEITVEEYNTELESLRKAFSDGNKI